MRARNAANEWYDGTLYSRLNDKAKGAIIIIMQRLHEDDLAGHVLTQEAWDLVSCPAIAEVDEEHSVDTVRPQEVHPASRGSPAPGARVSFAAPLPITSRTPFPARRRLAVIDRTKVRQNLFNLDPKIEIVRYEKTLPGEMIHIDIKKLGRIEGIGHRITGDRTGQSTPRSRKEGGKGWEYLHLAVDDHSRLAYSEILPDETRRSCLKFLFNALRFYRDHGVRVLRVMTDNGVSFRYAKALRMLKIKHKRTRPYTPRTNGKAARPRRFQIIRYVWRGKAIIEADE